MARIRTIKPDFFTSESVGALSWGARLTFAGLWTHVDDQGRTKDNPKVIRGALWPNDEETVSSADVARFIDEMAAQGMVCRYTVDGVKYLHVVKWKHQSINKPTASKLPECSAHVNGALPPPPKPLPEDPDTTPGGLPEDSRGEVEVEVEVEQGSGSGTLSLNSPTQPPLLTVVPSEPLAPLARTVKPDLFNEFWDAYPRHVGKAKAKTTFATKVKNGADPAAVVAAARSYADRCRTTRQDPQFIPHPTTWLNRESWTDDLDEALPPAATGTGGYQPYRNPNSPNAYEGPIR